MHFELIECNCGARIKVLTSDSNVDCKEEGQKKHLLGEWLKRRLLFLIGMLFRTRGVFDGCWRWTHSPPLACRGAAQPFGLRCTARPELFIRALDSICHHSPFRRDRFQPLQHPYLG